MPFSHLAGNKSAKELLRQLLLSSKQSHVLLFAGPKETAKEAFAKAFAVGFLGKSHGTKIEQNAHPDIIWLKPEGKLHMHAIASLDRLLQEAPLTPFESDKKIYIIEEADRMLPTSSNALLKILEEPPPHVSFILLSEREELLLPTVVSRCSKVSFFSSDAVFQDAAVLEAIREHFFAILSSFTSHSPFSIHFVGALSILDQALEARETEEGAVFFIVERLLEDVLCWIRDLHYRQIDPSAKSLFFADINFTYPGSLPSLETTYTLIEEARIALHRHVRVKTVLEALFVKLYKYTNT